MPQKSLFFPQDNSESIPSPKSSSPAFNLVNWVVSLWSSDYIFVESIRVLTPKSPIKGVETSLLIGDWLYQISFLLNQRKSRAATRVLILKWRGTSLAPEHVPVSHKSHHQQSFCTIQTIINSSTRFSEFDSQYGHKCSSPCKYQTNSYPASGT
jgi:hypothetical protein